MDSSQFQCPICLNIYGKDHPPMLICLDQHSACKLCVEKMFARKDKRIQTINCHLCRKQVLYKNIVPFYWLSNLIQDQEKIRKQGSNIRRLNVDLNEELKREREKVQSFLQLNQRQVQNQRFLEERFANMLTKGLEDLKKQTSAQIIASERKTAAKIQDCLKSQDAIKKDIQKKAMEQMKKQNEIKPSTRIVQDLNKKKIEFLQGQNKILMKEVTYLKQTLGNFTKKMEEMQNRLKMNENKMLRQPLQQNKNNWNKDNVSFYQNKNPKAQQINLNPFTKKSSNNYELVNSKPKLQDLSFRTTVSKDKTSQKQIMNSARIKTQKCQLRGKFVDYTTIQQQRSKNLMRQTMGPYDFKAVDFYKSGNQTTRNVVNGGFERQQRRFSMTRKASMPTLSCIQLQKEISFQADKCQRVVANIKMASMKGRRTSDAQLNKFVDQNIHLDQKQIMKKFESNKWILQ